MNPRLKLLQPYPFERLASLLDGVKAADKKLISWSIGEPKHAAPPFIAEILQKEMAGLSTYPLTIGEPDLREAIVDWLVVRFMLAPDSLDPTRHILPCNGTREALFAFAQAVVSSDIGSDQRAGKSADKSAQPLVVMPNPFYQIYEGAALLAGATPYYVDADPKTLCPDFDSVPEEVWAKCDLVYLSTPGNPTGGVHSNQSLQNLIKLSDQFNFVIASDECYSELYPDELNPPVGLLQAASDLASSGWGGGPDRRRSTMYKNCVVFHSLSKRSNLPGMRSGFVAGDPDIIAKFKLYRTYHGCAMPPPFQKASAAAWRDEEHVRQNRQMYRQKFAAVLDILNPALPVSAPDGAFYLWPQTPIDDCIFARDLIARQNLAVVPGSYLSRINGATNPGERRVRMALVAPLAECIEGAERLKEFVQNL